MQVTFDEVRAIRERIYYAQRLAAARFRDAFANGDASPLLHLELQANALVECAKGVHAHAPVRYTANGDVVTPQLALTVDDTPAAIFEYWLLMSEILTSPSWPMTRVLASDDEFDDALRRMEQPQIVRALHGSLLPDVDLRSDGRAVLRVVVYTRAGEERIEQRVLLLDGNREFHFHGREMWVEGRGGITRG